MLSGFESLPPSQPHSPSARSIVCSAGLQRHRNSPRLNKSRLGSLRMASNPCLSANFVSYKITNVSRDWRASTRTRVIPKGHRAQLAVELAASAWGLCWPFRRPLSRLDTTENSRLLSPFLPANVVDIGIGSSYLARVPSIVETGLGVVGARNTKMAARRPRSLRWVDSRDIPFCSIPIGTRRSRAALAAKRQRASAR
jgi:hypothetical protein